MFILFVLTERKFKNGHYLLIPLSIYCIKKITAIIQVYAIKNSKNQKNNFACVHRIEIL